jgi:HEAT repeat protein
MHQNRPFKNPVVFLTVLTFFIGASTFSCGAPDTASQNEGNLISLLQSDAATADKAIACKHLAVYGSVKAVPELAKLLGNADLASWARIPLEAIPGREADAALRNALDSLKGKLLVGTINSIGVRRDADAVESLAKYLENQDADAASAAAVALGNIGNAAAAKALRPALRAVPANVRSAVAEGCVLCAERLAAEGHSAEASEIYDEVRKAEVPKQRILEATRGSILTRKPDEGIALLVEQLHSSDRALFNVGLSTAREFPGAKIDAALAAELATAKPEQALRVIQAMADRKDTVILPAVLKAASEGAKQIRLAAIEGLGRIGDGTCLSTLLAIAVDKDAELSQAARTALSDLPGESVDKEIVVLLPKAEGKTYSLLISLVGQRRIDAVDELIKSVNHADASVRSAALAALGETVPAKNLSVLIKQVVSPKFSEDTAAAQSALMTACVRMPDREACAAELSAALKNAKGDTRAVLLQILGAVGGTNALESLAGAAKTADDKLQDVSSRLLGEWMTIDAAPVLLDLSKSAPGDKYQVRAMKGYIRIARQFIMPAAQREEMCELAFNAAKPAEQKMVLDVAKRYPSLAMLKLTAKAMDKPELKQDANETAFVIAQKIGGQDPQVQALVSKLGIEKVKVEIVKAEYGDGKTSRDVTQTLQRQIGDLQLVPLPKATYNTSFGGDPAPGSVKQLKVQYKINGKASEAHFAENALIILPMPK